MRSSLITIITYCLILCVPISVHSTEQHSEPEPTPTQQRQPQASSEDDDAETLDFSGTGRPGQQTAGESRSGCKKTAQPIRAMLPESNSGKTVLGHPRFWVYFPELDTETTEVEFIIQDESRRDIWRSRSLLNSTSSYQSFSLPKTQAPLEVGQWYRWYVKLYCGERTASTQYVQGWVERIPSTDQLELELQQEPQTHLIYGNHRIWYDAVDQLLNSYHRNPESLALEQDWQNIIRAKGVNLDYLPSIGGNQISQQ
ncbi:MAG: DUF928 domain-containing protein [Cyanobacteria bacterium P01_C01_bin.72]